MNRDYGTVFFFFAVVMVVVIGIGYFAHSKSDCDSKHGVLVKNAMGTYSCVEQGKH